jgi:2,3-dihydroxybenzoate decarboxylase
MNSHTMGERLDDPKFWDIFAAAEALDVPIYLHPNSPPRDMIQPYLEKGLDGARVRLPGRDRPAHAANHRLGRFDDSRSSRSSSAIAARRCRSGCTASTTCTAAATRANRHPHMRKLRRTPGEYLRETST